MEFMKDFEEAKRKDELRSKILKYIMYKKRTEKEIRLKFKDEDEKEVDEAIEYLKELGYIDDWNYIERSMLDFTNLRSLSLKEIRYKLCQKGIARKALDAYMEEHQEELFDYELEAARKVWQKKKKSADSQKALETLYQKGYSRDVIQIVKSEEGE